MEDIKVDFKLVVVTICISAIIGTLIWLGYYIYETLTKDENEGVPLFEEDMSLSKIENLETAVLEMSNWTEDGTYEDFIQDFMDVIKYIAINEEVEYKTRTLNIGGKDFYVPMMETEKLHCSYFCLAKDGFAYCIQAIIPKKLYTNHWEENLNKIFSTFTIL